MTTLALSYIPIIESMHVYLNGTEAKYGTDWTYDAVTNSVTALGPMEEETGDRFECRYAHRDDTVIALTVDVFHNSQAHSFAISFGVDAGPNSIIVIGVIQGGTSHTFTGRGTWTAIASHSYFGRGMVIYVGYDFGTPGTQTTLTLSAAGGIIGYLLDQGNPHPTLPTVAMSSWTDTPGSSGAIATGSVSASVGDAVIAYGGGADVGLMTGRTDTGVTLGADTFENNMAGTEIVSAEGEMAGAGLCSTVWARATGAVGFMGIILAVSV